MSESSPEPLVLGGREIKPNDRIDAYLFERVIGSGGMAHVLLARAPDGSEVALKVLKAGRLDTGLARFHREFYALSRLHHPNIIRVDAYGDLYGHPYIVMEYVDGPDLHTVIRDARNLDDARRFKRAEDILIQLCRALAAIHRRGLVHRDLKPSNVLMTRDGVCKLTDFGIVKDLDPRRNPHLSTTLVGTWAYTSPEHITGQPVDHRSDLYSLGVILFALLTGKRPFVAENMAGYLEQHRDRVPPRPGRVKPGVPAHLEEICMRLLEKAPRDRFQSASEILYRLEAEDLPDQEAGREQWTPTRVGQREAVSAVDDAVAALTDARGGLLRITGAEGSGRSSMVSLATERARMLGLPFHAFSFNADAPVFSVAIRLARELLHELSDTDSDELQRLLQAYAEGSSLRGDTRYALYDAVKNALATVLAQRPRVIALDDLHEAQGPELQLFHYLMRSLAASAGLPLLLVVSEREPPPDEDPEDVARTWGVTPWHAPLAPLSADDVRALVASLLGVGRAAELVAQRLHRETDGNPFFATEFLRSLLAQDLIRWEERGFVLAIDPDELAAGHLEIPPEIKSVLRNRLGNVREADRPVLDVLALARTAVTLEIVEDVMEADEEVVLRRLDRLIRAGIVRELRGQDELAYQVVHRQMSDIVVRDLPERKLKRLHKRLGQALEKHAAHDPEALGLAGEHYRRAEEAGRAYKALVGAARRLSERALASEAFALVEKASEVEIAAKADLSPDTWRATRLDHLWVRANALIQQARWEAAQGVLDELLTLAEASDDQRLRCDVQLELAQLLRRRGMLVAAAAQTEEALRTARRLHHRKGVAEALHGQAVLAWLGGDLDGCERFANEGLLVTATAELAEHRARLLLVMSAAQATRGQLASATRGLQEAEAIFRDLRMARLRVLALSNISELQVWQGEAEEAWSQSNEAFQVADALGYAVGRVAALRARGRAALELGRYGAAQNDLHAAVSTAREIALDEEALAAGTALTQLCLERSDPIGAIRHGAAALEFAEALDPERYLPLLQALLAQALARSRPEVAWTLLQAVEDALPTLHIPRRTHVRLATAWAWLALGDRHEAIRHAEEVVRERAARGFRLLNLEARALLARVTTGDVSKRHQRLGAELARDFTESMPASSSEEVRRRPFFRDLDLDEDTRQVMRRESLDT